MKVTPALLSWEVVPHAVPVLAMIARDLGGEQHELPCRLRHDRRGLEVPYWAG